MSTRPKGEPDGSAAELAEEMKAAAAKWRAEIEARWEREFTPEKNRVRHPEQAKRPFSRRPHRRATGPPLCCVVTE